MGYSHYWRRPLQEITPDAWQKICQDAAKLIAAGPPVAWEYDEPKRLPEVSPELIRFNGRGKDGHETFVFPRIPEDPFAFCKTAEKPYDKTVCAVLAVINDHVPTLARITSDGNSEEWQPALDWAAGILGRRLAMPLGVHRTQQGETVH